MPDTRQTSFLDDRYDLWRCAKCGREQVVRAVPHNPPSCCGTGMWYIEARTGVPYLNQG